MKAITAQEMIVYRWRNFGDFKVNLLLFNETILHRPFFFLMARIGVLKYNLFKLKYKTWNILSSEFHEYVNLINITDTFGHFLLTRSYQP